MLICKASDELKQLGIRRRIVFFLNSFTTLSSSQSHGCSYIAFKSQSSFALDDPRVRIGRPQLCTELYWTTREYLRVALTGTSVPLMGGDLGGTGGRSPKIWGGDGPCIRPSNILRSTVIGCVEKYELTKKRCQGGIFLSEIEVFGQEKKVVRNFGWSNEIFFLKEGRSIIWATKFFPSPKFSAKSPPMVPLLRWAVSLEKYFHLNSLRSTRFRSRYVLLSIGDISLFSVFRLPVCGVYWSLYKQCRPVMDRKWFHSIKIFCNAWKC